MANGIPDTIEPINPTIRERVRQGIFDLLSRDNQDQLTRQRNLRRANSIAGVLDFIPGYGEAADISDANKEFSQGNIGSGLLSSASAALGIIPVVGDAAAQALRTARFAGDIPTVARETGLLQRVGDVDQVNAMNVQMTPRQIESIPIVNAEDILDRLYVSGIVDTTRSGLENVTRINGVDIPTGGRQHGGVYYGFQPENLEKGAIFANTNPGDVTTIFNKAKKAREMYPDYSTRDVLFLPHGMGGQSPDFSTMITGLQIPYSRQTMSPSAKNSLDRRIREGYLSTSGKNKGKMLDALPDWPGIDSPEALDYLEKAGGKRKIVSKSIDEFRGDGALTLSQARAIVTDPSQFDPRHGALNAAYEIDMSRGTGLSNHPSYPTDFYGRALGAFEPGLNVMELNPRYQEGLDYISDRASKGSIVTPNMETFPNAKSTFGGLFGLIDRDMVDNMVARGLVRP